MIAHAAFDSAHSVFEFGCGDHWLPACCGCPALRPGLEARHTRRR
jgi:hypothetical protein